MAFDIKHHYEVFYGTEKSDSLFTIVSYNYFVNRKRVLFSYGGFQKLEEIDRKFIYKLFLFSGSFGKGEPIFSDDPKF